MQKGGTGIIECEAKIIPVPFFITQQHSWKKATSEKLNCEQLSVKIWHFYHQHLKSGNWNLCSEERRDLDPVQRLVQTKTEIQHNAPYRRIPRAVTSSFSSGSGLKTFLTAPNHFPFLPMAANSSTRKCRCEEQVSRIRSAVHQDQNKESHPAANEY